MAQQGIHFAPCTGKQVDRVEARLGAQSANFWILEDSGTRIKHQGRYVYQSLLGNALGLAIIRRLERLPGEHIVIACTAACAAIREEVPDHLKALVRQSKPVLGDIKALYDRHEAAAVGFTVFRF